MKQANRTSAHYGDMKREQQRDERIQASQELIAIDGDKWQCTDGQSFESRGEAINHQYDLLRNGHD